MRTRMLDDVLSERVVSLVARRNGRLGRFEAHVVPSEVLEISSDLAEPLRPHGGARGALASKKSGGERSERLGFVHFAGSLLADDSAAETTDGTRTGRLGSSSGTRGRKHGPAEILFQAV